ERQGDLLGGVSSAGGVVAELRPVLGVGRWARGEETAGECEASPQAPPGSMLHCGSSGAGCRGLRMSPAVERRSTRFQCGTSCQRSRVGRSGSFARAASSVTFGFTVTSG